MYIANLSLLEEAKAYDLCITAARNNLRIRTHLQDELRDEYATFKQQATDLLADAQAWNYGISRFDMIRRALDSMAEIQGQWEEHDRKNAENERVIRVHCGPRMTVIDNADADRSFGRRL
jgi:hypothetical protein